MVYRHLAAFQASGAKETDFIFVSAIARKEGRLDRVFNKPTHTRQKRCSGVCSLGDERWGRWTSHFIQCCPLQAAGGNNARSMYSSNHLLLACRDQIAACLSLVWKRTLRKTQRKLTIRRHLRHAMETTSHGRTLHLSEQTSREVFALCGTFPDFCKLSGLI